ncbi:hypothetical protein TrST_g13352 [Triparma strigata]|uniref:USP domain-containing protein n=1 Tax=Triparma strigata TaxID=1606541 RepID=A0A9W7BKW1_9STRA|nr:hypothetical protein TrST_g13352 [Triparma strigata]
MLEPVNIDAESLARLKEAVGSSSAFGGGGLFYFKSKEEQQSHTGLSNESMTCFLNSLMQNFYFSPLRARLYTSWSTCSEEEKERNLILKSLVTLFATMELTKRASVSTKALTNSFGWDASQRSNQSDIHELQTVLFDSINLPNLITELYEFKVQDNLDFTCPCGAINKRSKTQTVTDLQLGIKPGNFEASLKEWESLEIMEGENGVECEKCKKKCDAKKYQCISSLPPILNLCLRRLEFDMTTLRRVRVSSSFSVPMEISIGTGLSTEGGEETKQKYDLTSVMVRSGTANGGHYYSYNRSTVAGDSTWVKCNDSMTTTLSHEEMLSTLESLGTTVYMVVFVKCSFDEVCEVPEDLKETMEREEKEWGELRDIWNRKKEIVDLKITYGNGNGNGGAEVENISVKNTETLSDLLSYLCEKRNLETSNCRLRRYNFSKPGETFTGREDTGLEKLNINGSRSDLLFETKTDDEVFEDFFVDDLLINLLIVDCNVRKPAQLDFKLLTNPVIEGEEGVVYVQAQPFRKASTFSTMVETLKTKNGVGSPAIFYVDLEELKDMNSPILMDTPLSTSGLHLGSVLVYDNLPMKPSEVVKSYESFKNIITIKYNVPDSVGGEEKSVDIDKNLNIADLISSISDGLMDVSEPIYLRRTSKGHQIRSTSLSGEPLTLKKAGLIRSGSVHVEKGAGLGVNEYETVFYLRSKSNEAVLTCNINGDMTVNDVRELCFSKLGVELNIPTAKHLRCHDKPSNKLLRSTSKFSSTSAKKAESRQILLTPLTFSEEIPETSTVVSVKFLVYTLKSPKKPKVINSGTILPLPSSSIPSLLSTCSSRWGNKVPLNSTWSVAKSFKSIKDYSKLKWFTEGPITDLSLKDSDTIILRAVENGEGTEEEEKENFIKSSPWRGNVAINRQVRKERGISIKKYEDGLRTESA